MHLHNGVGMLWASIRDPLPEHRPSDKRMLGDPIGAGESGYTRYDRSITDLAIEWLRGKGAAKREPWCLYVGLVAPHFPLVAPQEFFDLYPLDSLPEPKLHPRDGHRLHAWSQEHEDFWSHEATLKDERERRTAIAAYYGLVSWLDHNIGRILSALEAAGLTETTRVIYSSDHGDNLGARGLWGKSNLYRESVDIPMIAAGPDFEHARCDTPVSLLDLSVTILDSVGLRKEDVLPQAVGTSLREIAGRPFDTGRCVFSEYHAVGSNTAGYMLRNGRWKYHHYVRHEPELFDLANDPEETTNLAARTDHAGILAAMERELRTICDPDETDRQAKHDQAALIERHGGPQAAFDLGRAVAGGTPAPISQPKEAATSGRP